MGFFDLCRREGGKNEKRGGGKGGGEEGEEREDGGPGSSRSKKISVSCFHSFCSAERRRKNETKVRRKVCFFE